MKHISIFITLTTVLICCLFGGCKKAGRDAPSQSAEDAQLQNAVRLFVRAILDGDRQEEQTLIKQTGLALLFDADSHEPCIPALPANKSSTDETTNEALFRKARGDYDLREWRTAAAGFRGIAFDAASGDLGFFAAMLYLESINQILIAENPAPSCGVQMRQDLQLIRQQYCKAQSDLSHVSRDCETIEKLSFYAVRLLADELFQNAEQAEPVRSDIRHLSYRLAGELYRALWTERCEADILTGPSLGGLGGPKPAWCHISMFSDDRRQNKSH